MELLETCEGVDLTNPNSPQILQKALEIDNLLTTLNDLSEEL